MAQENVEIVRRLLDAWNRRDIVGRLALADAEAEYVNPASAAVATASPWMREPVSEPGRLSLRMESKSGDELPPRCPCDI